MCGTDAYMVEGLRYLRVEGLRYLRVEGLRGLRVEGVRYRRVYRPVCNLVQLRVTSAMGVTVQGRTHEITSTHIKSRLQPNEIPGLGEVTALNHNSNSASTSHTRRTRPWTLNS